MTTPPKTCILIPTVDRYLAAARLTVRLLDEHWPSHPEIFMCGVDDPTSLPLLDPPSNWMAIVRRATETLRERGYERLFLILDDQGPLSRCHTHHLDHTVQAWMTSLGASYISLRGWDHRRNSAGQHMGPEYLYLQRQSPWFQWRFALHPALWNIDAFLGLFEILMGADGYPGRSTWDFEREAGTFGARLPNGWNDATFRVCGRRMSATPAPPFLRAVRHTRDGMIRTFDRSLRRHVVRHLPFRARLSQGLAAVLRTDAVMYDGPYPMHFSGFFVAGKLNKPLHRHLLRQGAHALAAAIAATAPR